MLVLFWWRCLYFHRQFGENRSRFWWGLSFVFHSWWQDKHLSPQAAAWGITKRRMMPCQSGTIQVSSDSSAFETSRILKSRARKRKTVFRSNCKKSLSHKAQISSEYSLHGSTRLSSPHHLSCCRSFGCLARWHDLPILVKRHFLPPQHTPVFRLASWWRE